jgi:ribonuclease HI
MGTGATRPGGYAALIRLDGEERIVSGRCLATTSSAMELTAVICALEALPQSVPARIYTDSQYVITGATERLPWWRSRGWRIVKGGRVANRDLWQRLSVLLNERTIQWHWVKGHAGDPLNERVHGLAYAQAQQSFSQARRTGLGLGAEG